MEWVIKRLMINAQQKNAYITKTPRSISKSDSNRLRYCIECKNVYEKTRYNNNIVMHGKHIPTLGKERELCKYCEDK